SSDLLEPGGVAQCLGQTGAGQLERVWCRDGYQAAYLSWGEYGGRPADEATPAMADDNGIRGAEGPDDTGDVSGGGVGVVSAWCLVAGAVPAQVHRDGAIPGCGDDRQLVAPGPPELGGAVQEEYERDVRRAALRD